MAQFLLLIGPTYLIALALLLNWAYGWFDSFFPFTRNLHFRYISGMIFTVFALLMPAAFFLAAGRVQMFFRRVGYMTVVVVIYLSMFIFAATVILWIVQRVMGHNHPDRIYCEVTDSNDMVKRTKRPLWGPWTYRILGTLIIGAVMNVAVYGQHHARDIQVHRYETTVGKSGGNIDRMKVVLIGDLHLGYNAGPELMEQMVTKINAENPDIVFVAGDIFDNQWSAVREPERTEEILAGIKAKYGVYGVMGNHDVEDNLIFGFNFSAGRTNLTDSRYLEFCEKAGIKILSDEVVTIDDSVYIVGRLDREETGNESQTRLSSAELIEKLDKSKTIIDLEHEPADVETLAAEGYDFLMAGHTHAGQYFPITLGMDLIWYNAWGYRTCDNLQTYVTSGVGCFGPYFRTLTDSEIMVIDIYFKEKQ